MATASDEYQERRRWAHESDSEEQQASPLYDAGLGGTRITLDRSPNLPRIGTPIRVPTSLVGKIWPLAAIAVGFALTGAWTVLLVFELLRAVDVPF